MQMRILLLLSQKIEDGTTVRNIYTLQLPTESNAALLAASDTQIFELNNAYNYIVTEFNVS
jgi:hypothetical protein